MALNKPLNESRCRALEDYVAANAHGGATLNFTCSNLDYFRVAGKNVLPAENALPDADFYMWWSRLPFWSTGPILQTLRAARAKGQIRRTARALILFDMTQWRDAGIEQGMHSNATWSTSVGFDEVDSCHTLKPADAKWQELCNHRANGSWVASTFALVS